MHEMIGKTYSHYTLLEKLGEGGMGVVYKAEDTRLDRIVALKFFSAELTGGQSDRARILQEAKAAAALNHPNVCAVIDVVEADDQQFIVMEYVDGKPLRIKRGSVSYAEAVNTGIHMARALAHAHRRGVIHRDIKMENIMMTREDEVKIMDFGLAMLQGKSSWSSPGAVLGTAAYMSPEQTRGEEVDHRTDLFSFGVVMFELLAGCLPFRGEHPAALAYSIINEEPLSLASLRSDVPPPLERIIVRCLEKDRGKRFQSAEELVVELCKVQRDLAEPPVSAAPQQVEFRQVTFADAVEEYPAWSPDGAQLVFTRETEGFKKLFIKDFSTGTERQLTGGSADDIQPAWSRDAQRILFVRSHQPNGRLEPGDIFSLYDGGDVWSHELETGNEQKIADNAFNPSFSPDGSWIAIDASWAGPRRIWLVDSRGRNPRQVTSDVSEAVVHIAPKWSPDGSRIVFQNVERVKFDIRVVEVNSGKMDWITDDMAQDIAPVWSPSGTEIYLSSFRSGGLNIWSIPISRGGSFARARQLTMGAGQDIQVAVSPEGNRLVYSNMRLNADIWRLPVDPATGLPTGPAGPVIEGTREESRGAWSPDGTMIALNSDRSGEMNIWVYALRERSLRQLTRGGGGDFQPNWSPDGRSLAFFSARSHTPEIWKVDVATAETIQLTGASSLTINPFYSPDGKSIAYHSDAAGRMEPWVMNADGSAPRRLAEMEAVGHFMRWSRDGRSVIFKSSNPFRPGLWVASLDGGHPVFLCLPRGGSHMSFSTNHELLMDVVDHKELWVTPVAGGEPYFAFKFDDAQVRIDYPVWSPDGKWVLFDRVKPRGGNIWMMENRT